jgi:hypothetical protein
MKQTTKVTLLSLLVFPGVGHLVLKKYLIGIAFISSSVYLLLGFIKEIHDKTQQVINSILRGEVPIEVSAIRQALIDQGVLENPNFATIDYLFLIIWGIAAFDAYRIANKSAKDITDSINNK